MAPAKPKSQPPGSTKTRRASNSQAHNVTAAAVDPEESKRVANRLAQRKFRRQRKDYIAHLEHELALCRAGASGELLHRRQEVAKLHEEKAELRELLEHVARNLSRICGIDISIGGESVQKQGDAGLGAVTPRRTESLDEDDQLPSHDNLMTDKNHRGHSPRAPALSEDPSGSPKGLDRPEASLVESVDTAEEITASIREVDLEMGRSDTDTQAPGLPHHPEQALSGNVVASVVMNHELPEDISAAWSQGTCQPEERPSIWAQHQVQHNCAQGSEAVSTQRGGNGNSDILLRPAFQKIVPDLTSFLMTAPGSLMDICRSSGCPGRHGGSEKTQLIGMILRRQVEEAIETCIKSNLDSFRALQTLERNLVSRLIDIILSTVATGVQLLGLRSLCMCGGSAWHIWQVAKTYWVIPRLADAGVLAAASELGFDSDVFHDTMPAWMRPTEIQKTFEHNAAIDFIPWAHLREGLIMHQDSLPIDDIIVNILSRKQPSGADTDQLVDLTVSAPWDSIRCQFQSAQDRVLRDMFYSSMSIWKLREESNCAPGTCATLLVDSFMAQDTPMLLVT